MPRRKSDDRLARILRRVPGLTEAQARAVLQLGDAIDACAKAFAVSSNVLREHLAGRL